MVTTHTRACWVSLESGGGGVGGGGECGSVTHSSLVVAKTPIHFVASVL